MREYYVIRLGRPKDPTKVLPGAQLQMEAPPRAQPARREGRVRMGNDGPEAIGLAFAPNNQQQGFYVKPFDTTDKSGAIVHTSEEAAETFAREMAAKHPQVLFGVFSCVKVFETTEPNVVVKTFNASNELVVESQV